MTPHPRSGYLTVDGTPVFTALHRSDPAASGRRGAVLMCPPFGWEEVCAYRCVRAWADDLARVGYTTLRLSYPSTGDSGGDVTDGDRLGAWVRAVTTAAAELRAATAASRLIAIGLGLGGMLALMATAGGAPIDDLVLWGVPRRGRSLVRQLRAISQFETATFFENLPAPEPLPPGELEAGGFRLSAETVAAVERVDLTALELPAPAAGQRRILMLHRDGIAPDAALADQLKRQATVTRAAGDGWGAMTSHPQTAMPAHAVFATVHGWLDQGPAGPLSLVPSERVPIRIGTAAAAVATPWGSVVERALTIPAEGHELSAVFAEPAAPRDGAPTVVLLNGGAVRRIGPNRMWVEAARRWAGHGVRVLRLDIAGIGDSDGDVTPYARDDSLYAPELVAQVTAALDHLEARGDGAQFVLGGLCAGAYWAFHAALEDPRVIGALMLNPRALIWDRRLAPARDLRALFHQPFSLARVRRSATLPRLLAVAGWLLLGPWRALRGRLESRASASLGLDPVATALERFLKSGALGLIVFSEREPLETELADDARLERVRAAGIRIDRLAVRDHTLRPTWAQSQAHAALDAAIERVLEQASGDRAHLTDVSWSPPEAREHG